MPPYKPKHSTTQRRSDREEYEPFTIIDFSVFSTSICNSACSYCDYWKNKQRIEFPATELLRLADTPLLQDVAFVLLGGEFTVHSEYLRILKGLNERHHPYYMFTNGILPERVYRCYDEAGGITNLSISVDGYESKHDISRGAPGNFQKIREIAEWVRRGHPETFLRFAYTCSPKNTKADLIEVMAFAKDLGVDVRVGYAQAISIFGQSGKAIPPAYDVSDLYNDKFIHLYGPWTKGWKVPCEGIYHHPAVLENGDLILCQKKGLVLGNVLARPFEDIWNDPGVRATIKSYESCNECWQSCQRKYDAERVTWGEIVTLKATYV